MRLLAWSQTDTGRVREANEDSLLVAGELRLYAVADGMGGHLGGARASSLALEVVRDEVIRGHQRRKPQDDGTQGETGGLSNRDLMVHAARRASATVYEEGLLDPSVRGMGTTLTASLYAGGKMHFCHAGDSRGYLLRGESLQRLTDDHSWAEEQVRAGRMTEDEAERSQFRHVITRSIGFEPDVEVDSVGVAVEAGDCFLLCSDGLTNYIRHAELEQVMNENWYSRLPRFLVELANRRGGEDNISIVVIYAANHVEVR